MKQHSLVLFFTIIAGNHWTGVVAPDSAGDGSFTTSEALFLAEGGVLKEGESKVFHNNRCKVNLQSDGNLVIRRLVAPYPYYQNYMIAWSTGPQTPASATFYATLDGNDGSLLIYRKGTPNVVVYTSNVGDPEALKDRVTPLKRDHRLTISEECVLRSYRDNVPLWTNNRYGGLDGRAGIGNFLQKGDMFNLNVGCYKCGDLKTCEYLPHTLYLQHDCNLVQFIGSDLADLQPGGVIWSSNSARTNLQNCYLYEDSDKVRLYPGKLDKNLTRFAPRAGQFFWEAPADFINPCGAGYEVLLKAAGGLEASC